MKNMITWFDADACQPLHADGLTMQAKRRTKAAFTKAIKAAVLPVMFDAHDDESEAFLEAVKAARLGYSVHRHIDALRRQAGFWRCVVYDATCKPPKEKKAKMLYYFTLDEVIKTAANTFMDYEILAPDAFTKRRQTEGRVKSVKADGKHRPKSKNAKGQTVDVCKDDYIQQRQAKSLNTHNAAAGVVARKHGFTVGQVKRAAERGKWFTG